jgi:serine/threonine protein kinase/formylglycine-generating enzyme required for sulfatase activity
MPAPIPCPKCERLVERSSTGSLPTHCPGCGGRLACPRCGSALERDISATEQLRCSFCQLTLEGVETDALHSLPAPTQVESAPVVPGFELRGKLGEGGMGVVYRAWQLNLNREVAIKVLPPALAANPGHLTRFRNEAELAGKLTDSHLLPVYDIREVQGVPIIVMPLIDGGDLGRLLKDRLALKRGQSSPGAHPWAALDDSAYLTKILPLLDQLVAAVTTLHQAGVVHRDIKPSNVLIDERGNAWLSDFGLARLQDQSLGTLPGHIIGTRAFSSPEQTRGDESLDLRTDLFSVGATLYQALTLELPFGKTGAREDSPPPNLPSRLQPRLSGDFDAVLLKTLETDRFQRYESAVLMQDDWLRVRKGQQPAVRLLGPARRWLRAARRHPGGVLAGLLITALALTLSVLLFRPPHNPEVSIPGVANAPESGSVSVKPTETAQTRQVRLETEPPNARVVLVPIHRHTGLYLPDQAIRPADKTPLTVTAPPGEYLIVAQIEGHGFHEVFRTVPRPKQVGWNGTLHSMWMEQPDGTVDLPAIVIPPLDITKGMAAFQGGEFIMGDRQVPGVTLHKVNIAPYYLDATEVTIGAYRKMITQYAEKRKEKLPPDSHAATWVTFDQAVHYAERIGKRLPDEAEYEFAATAGGTKQFPWGEDAGKITAWPIGPVGQPDYDRTATDPPVYGLFSNVAEWTTSRIYPYPGTDPGAVEKFYSPEIQAVFQGARIVRGGPYSVVRGNPDPTGNDKAEIWDPRFVHGINRDQSHPGLGFRCARSARPRFLSP